MCEKARKQAIIVGFFGCGRALAMADGAPGSGDITDVDRND
jgi:hypothetical protein